jgi:cyclase
MTSLERGHGVLAKERREQSMTRTGFGSSRGRRAILLLAAAVLLGIAGWSDLTQAQENQNRGQQNPPQPTGSRPNQNSANAEVHVLPVQGMVYMLLGAGGNITMQVGDDGILLVDSGYAAMSDKVLAAIRSVSDKPIRYIINTHVHADHIGGNEAIAKAGRTIAGGNVVGDIGASAGNQAMVIAFQTVLERMSAPTGQQAPTPQGALPTETYTTRKRKLYFNGEPIEIIHQPAAHTDGDSIVFFHKSDVVSTGDIFVTNRYPIVDLQRGGNIQGLIEGLNRVIDLTTVAAMQEGGTMVIPGHGRLCDQADVKFYQEMVTIIRDRIQDMIQKGMTLDQVKAAKPTRDYDPRYGADTGFWTTDMFVEAVYKSLTEKH